MTTNDHDASQNSDNPSDDSDASQAHSLSGYYADMLNMNSPYRKPALITRPVDQPAEEPTPESTVSPKSPQDKMSIVFGTRLASPGYRSTRYNPTTTSPESTWRTIYGVAIPPRPEEPDNCCMSGCVHCVWDDFRDDMEEWAGRVENAKAKSEAKTRTTDTLHTPRREVENASTSMDDDGGGSEANWNLPEESEDLFAGIPVGIREFMRTEKRLRHKHQHDRATA
ncbi:hypothetical protein PHISP_06138 [Aspergillus sp. HF37]|nr:hypothetical protein PHISP_06138 [Aspergillus sp. HF37]